MSLPWSCLIFLQSAWRANAPCQACESNCNKCSSGTTCTQCKGSKYLYNSNCDSACPSYGYYGFGSGATGRTCKACNATSLNIADCSRQKLPLAPPSCDPDIHRHPCSSLIYLDIHWCPSDSIKFLAYLWSRLIVCNLISGGRIMWKCCTLCFSLHFAWACSHCSQSRKGSSEMFLREVGAFVRCFIKWVHFTNLCWFLARFFCGSGEGAEVGSDFAENL